MGGSAHTDDRRGRGGRPVAPRRTWPEQARFLGRKWGRISRQLWWQRKVFSTYRPGEPLYFHHIPRTGGTSLIAALRILTPPPRYFTDRGNLSAALVASLLARGLERGLFVHGHPEAGAVRPLRGRIRIFTVLREPADQSISSYFWLRARPSHPDHEAAMNLDFPDFMATHPYYSIFQTGSLHAGIRDSSAPEAPDPMAAAPAVLAYLEEMDAVSTTDQVVQLLSFLAADKGLRRTPKLPRRNRSPISPGQRSELREQFAELAAHSDLGPFMAVERSVYERALQLSRARFGADAGRESA